MNLHIFEERYKELIHLCHDEQLTFGIPYVQDAKVSLIGTELELLAIKKTYEDGKMDVSCRGMGRYQIRTFYPESPDHSFPGAQVESFSGNSDKDFLTTEKLVQRIRKLYRLISVEKKLPAEAEVFRTFDFGHYIGLSQKQEY